MTIESTKLEKAVLLKVSGRMDADNAEAFRIACEKSIAEGALRVIADLDGLRYISSMGLRAFVGVGQALRACSGSLILCGLHGLPRQVFEITNLLNIFPVFESANDAIAAL